MIVFEGVDLNGVRHPTAKQVLLSEEEIKKTHVQVTRDKITAHEKFTHLSNWNSFI
jgi:hypothetical protein